MTSHPTPSSCKGDGCEFCLGAKGGVPGNENRIGGHTVCDYCTPLALDIQRAYAVSPSQAQSGWTHNEAIQAAHNAGFAGERWTMGPEELALLLTRAGIQSPPAPSQEQSISHAQPGDTLDMAYINSLPHPFMGRMLGGAWWPINDFEVETGLLRIDVCGKLEVKHIADFTGFRDGAGVERSAEAFYVDANEDERAPLAAGIQSPAAGGEVAQSDDIGNLRAFALAVLEDWPDLAPDAFDLQDLAVKHGLLALKNPRPTEPCGENCGCVEYFGADEWAEGVDCYIRTPLLLGAASVLEAAPVGGEVQAAQHRELTPPGAHPALMAASDYGLACNLMARHNLGTPEYEAAYQQCNEAWERIAASVLEAQPQPSEGEGKTNG